MSLVHSAFYCFTRIARPEQVAQAVREAAAGLVGSVVVAGEGINGAVAGSLEGVAAFERALTAEAAFAGAFEGMAFKRSSASTAPFGRLKVQVKERIVAFGPPDASVFGPRSTAVSPQEWRGLMGRGDVVVLDNRNSFEYRLGAFANAVDPNVSRFSDFEQFVLQHAEGWRRENKTVAMYCTGGIRCERVAPWMAGLGLKVAELEGGILNYFQQMPDASQDWRGECFVFDNRIALNTQLEETATGLEQVYEGEADGPWRIARAKRLLGAVAPVVD